MDTQRKTKWALGRYAEFRQNQWEQIDIDRTKSFLLIINAQLLIINKELVIKTLNLLDKHRKVESIYKNENIGFKVTDGEGGISKFKVTFANGDRNSNGIESCLEVVKILQKFIPVNKYQSHTVKQTTQEFKILPKLVEELTSENIIEGRGLRSVLSVESIQQGIISTLLDPEFPTIIKEVYSELNKIVSNSRLE